MLSILITHDDLEFATSVSIYLKSMSGSDSSRGLAIAGTVLGVTSTAMGVIILIFGPKAFKDYVLDLLKYMKWQSFFGARRYNWLLRDIEKNEDGEENSERIDAILRKVLRNWDPLVSVEKLDTLREVIISRSSGSAIFPLSLICSCVCTMGSDDKYYPAWKIVELMRQRQIRDVKRIFILEGKRSVTKLLLQNWIVTLASRILPIKIHIIDGMLPDEKNIENLIIDTQASVKRQLNKDHKIWVMLQNAAMLMKDICGLSKDIDFDVRINILLYLLDHFEFNILIKSFDLKKYLLKNLESGTFTI